MDNPYLQRRYLVSFASRRLPHIFTDVLVIGAGAAGVRAAIEAASLGEVILLTKQSTSDSNTWYAQGGMAVATNPEEDLQAHIADTLAAGGDLCDEGVVRDCLSAAPEHLRELREWGVEFDTADGSLALGREGGHGQPRIVHAEGDATGRVLINGLVNKARQTQNLKIFDQCFALDLLTDPPAGGHDARCVGALTVHPRFGMQIIRARAVVLASGGSGMLWRETSNPACATGDGVAMAFRAGVALADLEMMQFHPTTLYVAGASRSLISEAVRGEGAKLLDRNGNRFMPEYHEMAELAPRDVVSRAILDVAAKTGSSRVYLDVRDLGAEFFARRFPSIDRACREFDIDPAEDLIPVFPAAHYMVGGARVDHKGRTSLPGLFACGETSCTGLHGANRLASNSLTEAIVFGARCGRVAGQEAVDENGKFTTGDTDWTVQRSDRTELDLADIRNSLRSVMWRNVGIIRSGPRLAETLEIIQFWGRYVLDKEFFNDPRGWEVQNMLTAAWLVTELALRRTETRGVHYREDFPQTDPVWQRHQIIRRTAHQLVVE
jgi:L-aspartate oxidase